MTIGRTYLLIFEIFNVIVLLNLVIAILSTTYSDLNQYSLGLYYDSLVKAILQRKADYYYGAYSCTY